MDIKKFFINKVYIAIIAVVCSLLWGSAYPSIKIGYNIFKISSYDIPSKLIFAGYRFTMAGVMVLVVSLIINKTLKPPSKKNLPKLFLLGLFQTTLQYIFFYIGLANTTGVNGAILNSAGTFYSVILAHYLYRDDRINSSKIIGCIVGFLGVMLVNFTKDLMHFSFNFYGDGFVIISAIIASSAAIYGKNLSNSINTILLTGYQLLFGGILLTLLGFITGGHLINFTFNATILLIYMGFLSAAAFTLWTTLLKYNKVGRISIYNFLVPIFGAILSALFLRESIFQWKNAAALLLVCVGIFIVNNEI